MSIRLQQLHQKWQNLFEPDQAELGKHHLFNEIWQQYNKRLLFFIKPMLADDTEDALQEIMLKVYHNLSNYNPVFSFNTWIYTIARNHCINFMAKKRLITTALTSETEKMIFSLDSNPENELINKEACQQIDGLLEALPARQQQMAFLRFYEGMKIKAIANVFDIPTGSVKSRLYLIKKRLKKELEVCDVL